MTGAELIAVERERQIYDEGWTQEHDDEHRGGELSQAAICYAYISAFVPMSRMPSSLEIPTAWPWDEEWWKPSSDPIRNLVKAGALICAEIDRLQRAKK